MEYEDFTESNLLILDNDGFPTNLTVKLMFEEDKIILSLIKGINFTENQKCKLQLRIADREQLFFRTKLIDGKIQKIKDTNQYKFIIEDESQEIIDTQYNLISQLVSTLPEGKQPIQEFNQRLLNEILTEENQGLLTVNIANNTHIYRIRCVPSSGSLKFETEHGSKLSSIMQYTTQGSIVFDKKEKALNEISMNGEIKLAIRTKNTEIFNFTPRTMIYGQQSNMETLQIENKTSFLMASIARNLLVKTKYWYNLLRLPLILFSLIPLLVGSVLADTKSSNLNFQFLFLEIIAIVFFQSAANLLNDYFDHKSDSDEYAVIHSKLNAGSRFLQLRLINEDQIKIYSLLSLLFGVILGVYINYRVGGIDVLIIGIIGALIILFYSLPPLKLSYRWYGDIAFAFTIFPLILIGSSFVQEQRYNNLLEISVIGLTMASFVTAILFVGNIMSYDAEKAAQKTTFTVKFGKKHTITTMIVFLFLHYLVEFILFAYNGEFILLIPIIGSSILAFYALKLLKENVNNIVIQERSYRTIVYAFLLNYIPIVVLLSI
ncbi:MAG: prenyltransferase [Candidatus Heimdallarchaeota archaeon]|nr:prenyltransferase [Candidatus Heimdallarchaeota archaeon]